MGKKSGKRKIDKVNENDAPQVTKLPTVRYSDEPVTKKAKWLNRQRVLVFASRGISHRDRHLMEDLKKLMPHHKPEAKMERSKTLSVINEMCEMKNCNKAMMFEGRKKRDLYLWLANVPNGPSVKFLVENIYTMAEFKLTGNCLRGSRPLLSFDPSFEEKPHYSLLKEIFTQTFSVPNHHPKSQPFFDHVYTFSILDNRIWFRNYQILSEDGALAEIGPRFVLNPVKIFSGSFTGTALWENPSYISPAKYRQQIRLSAKDKYVNRVQKKIHNDIRPKVTYKLTPLSDIFDSSPAEKAEDLAQELESERENQALKQKSNKKKKAVGVVRKKKAVGVVRKKKAVGVVRKKKLNT